MSAEEAMPSAMSSTRVTRVGPTLDVPRYPVRKLASPKGDAESRGRFRVPVFTSPPMDYPGSDCSFCAPSSPSESELSWETSSPRSNTYPWAVATSPTPLPGDVGTLQQDTPGASRLPTHQRHQLRASSFSEQGPASELAFTVGPTGADSVLMRRRSANDRPSSRLSQEQVPELHVGDASGQASTARGLQLASALQAPLSPEPHAKPQDHGRGRGGVCSVQALGDAVHGQVASGQALMLQASSWDRGHRGGWGAPGHLPGGAAQTQQGAADRQPRGKQAHVWGQDNGDVNRSSKGEAQAWGQDDAKMGQGAVHHPTTHSLAHGLCQEQRASLDGQRGHHRGPSPATTGDTMRVQSPRGSPQHGQGRGPTAEPSSSSGYLAAREPSLAPSANLEGAARAPSPLSIHQFSSVNAGSPASCMSPAGPMSPAGYSPSATRTFTRSGASSLTPARSCDRSRGAARRSSFSEQRVPGPCAVPSPDPKEASSRQHARASSFTEQSVANIGRSVADGELLRISSADNRGGRRVREAAQGRRGKMALDPWGIHSPRAAALMMPSSWESTDDSCSMGELSPAPQSPSQSRSFHIPPSTSSRARGPSSSGSIALESDTSSGAGATTPATQGSPRATGLPRRCSLPAESESIIFGAWPQAGPPPPLAMSTSAGSGPLSPLTRRPSGGISSSYQRRQACSTPSPLRGLTAAQESQGSPCPQSPAAGPMPFQVPDCKAAEKLPPPPVAREVQVLRCAAPEQNLRSTSLDRIPLDCGTSPRRSLVQSGTIPCRDRAPSQNRGSTGPVHTMDVKLIPAGAGEFSQEVHRPGKGTVPSGGSEANEGHRSAPLEPLRVERRGKLALDPWGIQSPKAAAIMHPKALEGLSRVEMASKATAGSGCSGTGPLSGPGRRPERTSSLHSYHSSYSEAQESALWASHMSALDFFFQELDSVLVAPVAADRQHADAEPDREPHVGGAHEEEEEEGPHPKRSGARMRWLQTLEAMAGPSKRNTGGSMDSQELTRASSHAKGEGSLGDVLSKATSLLAPHTRHDVAHHDGASKPLHRTSSQTFSSKVTKLLELSANHGDVLSKATRSALRSPKDSGNGHGRASTPGRKVHFSEDVSVRRPKKR